MTSGRTVLPLRFISISLAAPRVLIVQLFVGFSSSYSVIHVLLIVEGKKHGKVGSSICFHRFLELSLKLRIAGLRKKEIANSKAWFPAFSLEISAMAAPPNLRPLFQTRWCSGLSFLLITSTRGYVGEDGGEKYNWERYAERFTKHL
ncbi:uncharacterized protein [Malus domestica]|uniref:uncharacterized protein n=1 Tax=Malus domestica TaxID=3750 RepID=UPI00397722B9